MSEDADDQVQDEAPKRRGRQPKPKTDDVPAHDPQKVKVRVLRSSVHDGAGGKFYQGAEPEVSEDVALVWIENGWAEPL